MERPEKRYHQHRYPEAVPPEVEAEGPEAVAAWVARKAAEWEAHQAVLRRRIALRIEVRRSLMELTNDARTLVCKFMPPLDMYMLYESNLGVDDSAMDLSADDKAKHATFREWCNQTQVEDLDGQVRERACIWDELLRLYYPQAGPRDPRMTGDERRWRLYAWAVQGAPNLAATMYTRHTYWFRHEPESPDRDNGYDFTVEDPEHRNTVSLEFGWGFTQGDAREAQMDLLQAIRTHGLGTEDGVGYWYVTGAPREGPSSAAHIMAIIFYEAFRAGWHYSLRIKDDEVAIHASISCNTCGAPDAQHLCDICGNYAFCSQACGDALAEQHQRVCYSLDEEDGHVAAITAALALLPEEESHAHHVCAIEAYLEEEERAGFPPHVLDLIAATTSRRKTRHRQKRVVSHKRHIKSNKAQSSFHKKQAAKHHAVLQDKNATSAQKRAAKKQHAFHTKRAEHHDRRAAVHGSAKARRKAQLASSSKQKKQMFSTGGGGGGGSNFLPSTQSPPAVPARPQPRPQAQTPTSPPPPPPRDEGETIPERHAREKAELERRHAAELEVHRGMVEN